MYTNTSELAGLFDNVWDTVTNPIEAVKSGADQLIDNAKSWFEDDPSSPPSTDPGTTVDTIENEADIPYIPSAPGKTGGGATGARRAPAPATPGASSTGSGTAWWPWLIGGVVLVAGGVIAVKVVKSRRRKGKR